MLQKMDPKELTGNVFSQIGEQWMLITAGTTDHCNTMTAGWGGLGVLWHRPVATVYIRPQRYTYELVEKNDFFTLSFYGEEYRRALALCGSKSGRDIDKVKECGFTVAGEKNAPYFAQAQLVLVCRKLYYSDLDPTHFLDDTIDQRDYPGKDYHRMYIGEITQALKEI